MNRLRIACLLTLAAALPGIAAAQSLALSMSPASPITYGTPITLTATITANNCDNTFVTFEAISDNVYVLGVATAYAFGPLRLQCSATLSNAATSGLGVGTYGITTEPFLPAERLTLVVNPAPTTITLATSPNPSTVGQTVTLTATVSPASATGSVSFWNVTTVPPIPLGSASLVNGSASVTATLLHVGTHNLQANYVGDNDYQGYNSRSVTQTVNQVVTTTTLQATPTSTTPGQAVSLTATVSPSTATGTITFLDGPTNIGTAPLIAGTANVSTFTLSIGSHSLTASYGGDTNDTSSASAAVTVSVGLQPTTTTLAAAPNPAAAGQGVTLTATVTPGNPTGTVSFFDGANLLGTPAVSNGVATFHTSTLSTGSHSLTASYGGDTNNAPSTSAAVNESVTGVTGSTTPNPVSVTPSSGNGSSQVMSFTFNDSRGWQDLDVVNVLINNSLDGRNACYLAYSRSAGLLYLVADNGGTLSTGLVLGGSGSVSDSQCIVTAAASAAAGSGNTLTVTLNIIFTPGFGGNKVVYMAARDLEGGNSGWQALGVWQATFTPAGTISVLSLTQARSAMPSGTPQTFTATLADSQGVGDFGVVNLLANNFIDGRNACYLAYVAAGNSLLLVDDGGDAGGPFAGSITLNGSPGAIQNSQCSVNSTGSAAAKTGNTLTLTLNITFKSGLAGNRIVWVAGRNTAGGNNTDWQAMGTTTVQ